VPPVAAEFDVPPIPLPVPPAATFGTGELGLSLEQAKASNALDQQTATPKRRFDESMV
jgi:hypothetical protein